MLSALMLSACHWQTRPDAPFLGSAEQRAQAEEDALAIFDEFLQDQLDNSPVLRSRLGMSSQFDWDDISAEAREQQLEFYHSLRQRLQEIPEEALDLATRTTYRALMSQLEYALLRAPFERLDYEYSQLGGWHTDVVDVLLNYQAITNLGEAHDYLARLRSLPSLFNRWIENIKQAEETGTLPPAFVFDDMEKSIELILTGAPFTNTGESLIWADFRKKINHLGLYSNTQTLLERRLRTTLLQDFKPAYERLLNVVKDQRQRAPVLSHARQDEASKRYYQIKLAHYSNSNMDANQIHQIGLAEVGRIQQEMRRLMPVLGYQPQNEEGKSLAAFFNWMRDNSPRFNDDEQGRDEFLGFQRLRLKQAAERLPYFFTQLPSTAIAIKPVEHFRQPYSPLAFYAPPSVDGVRPGIYFANPGKAHTLPRYLLATILFHEAIPGHHMQTALALENNQLHDVRRVLTNPALKEGWALYSEKLASEMDLYADAEELYGRLVMELHHTVQLVLDTGLHAKGWSIEQAVNYRTDNTPFSAEHSLKEVRKHLVNPARATANKLGEMRLLTLRRQIQDRMGSRFDIAKYHSELLSQGALPLDVLEDWMMRWASAQ